jgi:predicted  nucleic acid-binding Zn-ribbon protein
MLPILEQLLVIQDRDRHIAQLSAEKARTPAQVAAVEARVAQESARLDSLRSQLKILETDRKKLELEAESKRGLVTKYQTQQYQIKSNTEYQALSKEIAREEEEIGRIEDRELELMERAEQLQLQLKEEQATLQQVSARAQEEKAELQARSVNIEKELTALQAERQTLASQTDAEMLHRYERLMRSKGDAAIVPIRHGNCGGCHLKITAQLVHDARHSDTLVSCEYCGRILYWQAE